MKKRKIVSRGYVFPVFCMLVVYYRCKESNIFMQSWYVFFMLTVPTGCFCLVVLRAVNVGVPVWTNHSRIDLWKRWNWLRFRFLALDFLWCTYHALFSLDSLVIFGIFLTVRKFEVLLIYSCIGLVSFLPYMNFN